MNIKILTVIFSLFFSSLYAAGTDSGDSAKTNYGKDYKSAIKLISCLLYTSPSPRDS